MKEKLISILETFGYPVMLQGSLAKDAPYPDSFFTFWVQDTTDGSHYNNRAISTEWTFNVNFYSVNVTLVNTILLSAKKKLIDNGFIVDGKGYDLATDEPTHTGQGFTALYLQMEVYQNAES